MAERIRYIRVTIEVETNKQTIREVVSYQDDDTTEEFETRVSAVVADVLRRWEIR